MPFYWYQFNRIIFKICSESLVMTIFDNHQRQKFTIQSKSIQIF